MVRNSATYSDEERRVLLECRRREVEIAAMKPPPKWATWDRKDYDDVVEYGPRYSPAAWFVGEGEQLLPDRYRVRFLRAVRSLGARGLLRLTATGGRLTHVKLTPEGLKVVQELEGKVRARGKAKPRQPAGEPSGGPEATATSAGKTYEEYREEAAANPDRAAGRHIDPIPAPDEQPVEPAGGGE